MNEKRIIICLIAAFEHTKNILELDYTNGICTNGICSQVSFFINNYIYEEYYCMQVKSYFRDFFRPKEFDIEYLYRHVARPVGPGGLTATVIKQVETKEVDPKEQYLYFWYPLEAPYNVKRIEICDKAIDKLNKRLEQLEKGLSII